DDLAPPPADPRIDDGHVDGPRRKLVGGLEQDEGGRRHVLRRHVVADVDDARARRQTENGALHGAHVAVGGPEIGRQRDEGHAADNLQRSTTIDIAPAWLYTLVKPWTRFSPLRPRRWPTSPTAPW